MPEFTFAYRKELNEFDQEPGLLLIMITMNNLPDLRTIGLGLALAGLAACQSPATGTGQHENQGSSTVTAVTAAMDTGTAPMELDDEQLSAWNYLAGKYDADGDGRVTPEECGRDNFERLDRNGDGALTADDYTGGDDSMETMMAGMRAQAAVFAYFQADDEVATLEREELAWAFSEYDDDQDGTLTEAEFDALAEDKRVEIPAEYRMARMLDGDFQPWPSLTAGIDADGDSLLARSEVDAFFDDRDDGDGIWTMQNRRRPTAETAERAESKTGAMVGTIAPDFTLAPPDGGAAVTLSSFKDDRPVALIFGSYT